MLVKADGSFTGSLGGGELDRKVAEEALQVIRSGKSKRIRVGVSAGEERKRGMEPGGTLKYFVELVDLIPRLYIFGAGELSLRITRFARLLNYDVTVIDTSSEFANSERFPDADIMVGADYSRVFPQTTIGPSGYIIIATRNHEQEEKALELSLRSAAKYIGMAACSEQKKKRYLAHMADKGFPAARLNSVHAPIGIEIHAQTMEEIALSIMAEIVGIIRSEM